MALIARVAQDAFGTIPAQWGQVLAALAVVSMFLGAIAAIGQKDIKRLMAYSSIAHMGYALIGLAVGTAYGVQATLIYMAIYVTMNIGTFAFILSMERDGRPVTDIAGLNQFSKTEPLKALALLVLMFSLAGVPPMVGFFGKFYVLKAAVDAGMVWLAVAGAVASVIGAFYYLRIVYFMYFGAEQEPVQSRMAPVQWVMMVAVAAIMVLGVINLFGIEPAAATAAQALVQ
jgi:NADH-quinone oxidoreductase subunit N